MPRNTRTALAAAVAALVALPAAALAQHDHGTPAKGTAPAAAAQGAIELSVTPDGWVPDRIRVKAGEKVRLVITRKTDRTCATEIVIRELGVNTKLPLNQPVTVEFTPKKSGVLKYTCAMDMISGTLIVQ